MSKLTRNMEFFKEQYPDRFKVLCEAMYKSKGEVNNEMGFLAAINPFNTADDVVKAASHFDIVKENIKAMNNKAARHYYGTREYDDKLWVKEKYGTREDVLERRRMRRKNEFDNKRKYSFKDTFLYRAMEKYGFADVFLDDNAYSDTDRVYSTNIKAHGYYTQLKDTDGALTVAMFAKASKDLRNVIVNDAYWKKLWVEKAKVERNARRPYSTSEQEKHTVSFTDDDWRNFQVKHIIKEFDMLTNMPDELKAVADDFAEYKENHHKGWYRERTVQPTLLETIRESFRYPCEDKSVELVEEAYKVMEYMGIGVTYKLKTGDNYNDSYSKDDCYKVADMLRKVSSMMRRFVADIKKGFTAEDVRELVVEDLNRWVQTRGRDKWTFYARKDAKNEYEDIAPKKSKKKNNPEDMDSVELCGKSKRGIEELDENNPDDANFLEVLKKFNNNNEE